MKESLKDRLMRLTYLTEKDYTTTWDGSVMTIREVDTGIVVASGSEEHCEKCVDRILLLFRMV